MQSKTEFDYRLLAHKRGFTWVGPALPADTLTPTTWRCANGHTWLARYSSIHTGSGCRQCAGLAPKTAEDYHKLATEQGLLWVGEELPTSVAIVTRWRFPDGNIVEYSYSRIKQYKRRSGSGVPTQSKHRVVRDKKNAN